MAPLKSLGTAAVVALALTLGPTMASDFEKFETQPAPIATATRVPEWPSPQGGADFEEFETQPAPVATATGVPEWPPPQGSAVDRSNPTEVFEKLEIQAAHVPIATTKPRPPPPNTPPYNNKFEETAARAYHYVRDVTVSPSIFPSGNHVNPSIPYFFLASVGFFLLALALNVRVQVDKARKVKTEPFVDGGVHLESADDTERRPGSWLSRSDATPAPATVVHA